MNVGRGVENVVRALKHATWVRFSDPSKLV